MGIADLPRPVGYVLGGGGSLGAVQVGMLQALSEHDVAARRRGGHLGRLAQRRGRRPRPRQRGEPAVPPVASGSPASMVFPGGLLAQARTLQHAKTHLFPSTGLAAVIGDFLGPEAIDFADLALPFAAVAMDVATARPHVLRDGPAAARAAGQRRDPRASSRRWTIGPSAALRRRRRGQRADAAGSWRMGARSLVVLDCSFPGTRPRRRRTRWPRSCSYTALVTMRTTGGLRGAARRSRRARSLYLPGPDAAARLAA